jgi:hypothetical protein
MLGAHGVEFSATHVAEVSQSIITVRGPRSDLLGRQIRLRVNANDVS